MASFQSHPFNPAFSSSIECKSPSDRRRESNTRHSKAMRKIDDIRINYLLKNELLALEL